MLVVCPRSGMVWSARQHAVEVANRLPDLEVVALAAGSVTLHLGGDPEVIVVIMDPYPVRDEPMLDAVRYLSTLVPVLVVSGAREPANVLA